MKKLLTLIILILAIPAQAQQLVVGVKPQFLFDNFNLTKFNSVSLNLQDAFRVPKSRPGEEVFVAWGLLSYTYSFPYEYRGAGNIPNDFVWGGQKFQDVEGKIVDISGSISRHRIEMEIPWERYTGRQTVRPLVLFDLYNASISLSNFDNNNKRTYGEETWNKSNFGIGLVLDTPMAIARLKGKAVYTFMNGSNGWFGEVKAMSGFYGVGVGFGYMYSTKLIEFGTGNFRSTTQGPYVEVAVAF